MIYNQDLEVVAIVVSNNDWFISVPKKIILLPISLKIQLCKC